MRYALIAALALMTGAGAMAADTDKDVKAAEHKAVDGKAINTIDPVNGEKVDVKIAPIEAKTKDGKIILIGVSTQATGDTVKKDPEKFIDAALANKKTEEKTK
ncbi:MAG: hypothetical protein H0V44_08695 [Planctomycetes bacterium]|nr:hypothetical protein [Planctomycetota bacterium]